MNIIRERILNNIKIIEETGCWEWQLSTQRNGYGQIKFNKKMCRAHRVSYSAFNGEIPEGQEVMHSCDNRRCVNPDHLSVGTHQQNMSDIVKRGRQRTGPEHQCFGRIGLRGINNPSSIQVEIGGIVYGSIKEAERLLGVANGSVRYWVTIGKARRIEGMYGK